MEGEGWNAPGQSSVLQTLGKATGPSTGMVLGLGEVDSSAEASWEMGVTVGTPNFGSWRDSLCMWG